MRVHIIHADDDRHGSDTGSERRSVLDAFLDRRATWYHYLSDIQRDKSDRDMDSQREAQSRIVQPSTLSLSLSLGSYNSYCISFYVFLFDFFLENVGMNRAVHELHTQAHSARARERPGGASPLHHLIRGPSSSSSSCIRKQPIAVRVCARQRAHV